jgi:hypothetical protein
MEHALRTARALAMLSPLVALAGCGGEIGTTGTVDFDGGTHPDTGGDVLVHPTPAFENCRFDGSGGFSPSSTVCAPGTECNWFAGSTAKLTCDAPTGYGASCGHITCGSFCSCMGSGETAYCDCFEPVTGPLPPPDLAALA